MDNGGVPKKNVEKWKFVMPVPPFHDNTFVGKQATEALV